MVSNERTVACGCTVLQVSFLTCQHGCHGQHPQELFVYDIQTGVTSTCTFGEDLSSPRQHTWDSEHPLLLTCEMSGASDSQHSSTTLPQVTLVTLFATPHGAVLQDSQSLNACQVDCFLYLRFHSYSH